MVRFNKGFLFGSLMGAGLIWLSTTKKGKEIREQAMNHAEKIYEIVKQKALATGSWDKLSKTKFAKLASEAAGEYSSKNGLAGNIVKMAERLAGSKWVDLKKEAKKKAGRS